MSNPNRSLCDDPFRVCLNWMNPKPSFDSTSPPNNAPHGSAQPGSIHQQPPAAYPMKVVRIPPSFQPVPKHVTRQSGAWKALGTALKTLEVGVGIFPPLKAAVSELLACTTNIQIAEQNRQEYDQLAADLVGLVQSLQTHLSGSKPRWVPYSIENVARSISEQAVYIKQHQDYSGLTQAIRASDNAVNIIGCYRRVEHIFRQLQTDIALSIWDLAHEQRVNTSLKDLNPVHDARYNAALSVDMQRRGCTPNTRVNILKEAIEWTRSLDTTKIYWMNGMAGTGKTTIAYSLCEQLEKFKQLGACFFCSQVSPDCRDVNKIIPTIAYQLARFSNPYQNELCEILINNPDIAKRDIFVQFGKLVVEPLKKVKGAIPTDVVIVIDALNECSDTRGTRVVLELLSAHATSLPVKFFVTSRPEPTISTVLSPEAKSHHVFLLHDVEESLVQADIYTYLERELQPIKAKPIEIQDLTARAGCLFIFAATVVRYIDPQDPTADHAGRLTTMLGTYTPAEGKAYRELDELYSAILSQALLSVKGDDREREMRCLALRAVIAAREPLDVPALAEIMASESEEAVQRALLPLRSVLRVSTDTKSVSTLHASFPEFMLNPDRSKEFYWDMSEQNAYMATRCFDIMRKSLRFNICNLETSSRFDEDVPDLQERAEQAISSGLFYACCYWGDHLHGIYDLNGVGIVRMIEEFLRNRLLFWVEVLNLKDRVGSTAGILLQASSSLPEDESLEELRNMIQDSRNFVTTYAASPASRSTPHIYISALPLAPTQGFIRTTYFPRMEHLAQIEGAIIEERSNAALATWVTGSSIKMLALSKNGKRVVSGADNGEITLWEVDNGRRLLGPLKKHNGSLWSISLSPNGSMVASGSEDGTIYISNADTGATLVGPVIGHTASIHFLSFSPDNACLASASEDHTIRIWDTFTGAQIGTELRGHQGPVMCVIFSSNGNRLVSCSVDRTIRVWDWRKGITVHEPFEGHTSWIDCVALSPDDAYIASCGRDRTVRIWNMETGKITVGPLTGHGGQIYSIAFSPDGKRVVSGSYDKTIRVWNSETGDLIGGAFRGHEGHVYSALFSPDGTYIISGSTDGTIRIWDASRSITSKKPVLVGHTKAIMSVALSPDGTRVVSGSQDHKIRVWDTQTGSLVLGPLTGHSKAVESVAYTPDGACIVSGSLDCTIRTWDAHTGLALADPLTKRAHEVRAVAISPDGRLVASGSSGGSVKIWELRTGLEAPGPQAYHTGWVRSVNFSPNGSYIASGSNDHSVCLWNADTGSLIRRFAQHTDQVMSVRFSPDSTRIISCSKDSTLISWDVNTGGIFSGPWKGHDDAVRAIAFSPDGTMVVSVSADRTTRLWDAGTGIMLATPFRGHTDWVYSVAFTPDGQHLVSGSADRTIRFWDLNLMTRIQHQAKDGQMAGDDGWVRDSRSQLILWLPPDLKDILGSPPCSLVIRPTGAVRSNLRDITYGNGWADYYAPLSSSDTPRF